MNSISDFLGNDHHRCDALFADAEAAVSAGDWDRAAVLVCDFLDSMHLHFSMEEDMLFPDFEAATGMVSGPTAVMRMEHAQMRQLFDEMEEAAAKRDAEGYLGAGETLLMMMQQHNAKEEQVLYPMADRVLGEGWTGMIERKRKTA